MITILGGLKSHEVQLHGLVFPCPDDHDLMGLVYDHRAKTPTHIRSEARTLPRKLRLALFN
jgi:hypothetical protein